MATIKFVDGDERKLASVRERAINNPQLRDSLEKPGGQGLEEILSFTHHPGSAEEPRLFEVQFPPHHKQPSHAHDVDEIIVVLDGEIRFGKQSYEVGSSIFIPKMTLYAFEAGPEGLRFLNFRPTISTIPIIYKDEFLAKRAEVSL